MFHFSLPKGIHVVLVSLLGHCSCFALSIALHPDFQLLLLTQTHELFHTHSCTPSSAVQLLWASLCCINNTILPCCCCQKHGSQFLIVVWTPHTPHPAPQAVHTLEQTGTVAMSRLVTVTHPTCCSGFTINNATISRTLSAAAGHQEPAAGQHEPVTDPNDSSTSCPQSGLGYPSGRGAATWKMEACCGMFRGRKGLCGTWKGTVLLKLLQTW